MGKLIVVIYGAIAYLLFFGSFVYAIGFIANYLVPKSIDSGPVAPLTQSLVVNLVLLGAFAVQHSVMARPAFKAWWTKIVPTAVERSTYVLFSSLLLLLLCWQWRAMPTTVWSVDNDLARTAIWAVFLLGWVIIFIASFLISHFDLFGLRQVYLHWKEKPYTELPFTTAGLYKLVRHPIMLGFIIGAWATPDMTQGHLLFAVMITAYAYIGVYFEEKDLNRAIGEEYGEYSKRVPKIFPRLFGG